MILFVIIATNKDQESFFPRNTRLSLLMILLHQRKNEEVRIRWNAPTMMNQALKMSESPARRERKIAHAQRFCFVLRTFFDTGASTLPNLVKAVENFS